MNRPEAQPDQTRQVPDPSEPARVIEGRDYYLENGFYVFTAEFLLRRGYCCGNGCRHCPYNAPNK